MTRKEDFFNLYDKYKDDTNFMVIGIEMPDLESHELIVNHKSNFEEKMKYYDSVYDENLIMIRNRDIKIVSFMFAEEVIFAEEEEEEDGDKAYFDFIEEVEYNGMLSHLNNYEIYKKNDSLVRRDDEHVLAFAELCRQMGLSEEEL